MVCFLVNESINRDKLRNILDNKKIETRPIFNPINLMPMYNFKKEKFINAENISSRGINLPSFSELKEKELNYICDSISEFISSI